MGGIKIAKTHLIAMTGALLVMALASPAYASHVSASGPINGGHGARLVIPIMNAEQGKKIFVDKGCVACHAVNGVGGHDAPPMDAHRQMGLVNPFDFAAKMWNHAPGMIAAQEGAFGQQIYFTGEELAHMIAFLHDDQAQHDFGESDLSEKAQEMMHHEHGEKAAPAAHAEEVGHGHDAPKKSHEHAAGTAEHQD